MRDRERDHDAVLGKFLSMNPAALPGLRCCLLQGSTMVSGALREPEVAQYLPRQEKMFLSFYIFTVASC